MSRAVKITAALGLLALGAVAAEPSMAVNPVRGYAGQAPSSVAGCPYIVWRLVRHEDGEITGIVYYSDLSGMSTAKGAVNQEGQFHLQLTSSMGQGPAGTVDGTKSSDGTTSATMQGAGCANMHVTMNPEADLNEYHQSNG